MASKSWQLRSCCMVCAFLKALSATAAIIRRRQVHRLTAVWMGTSLSVFKPQHKVSYKLTLPHACRAIDEVIPGPAPTFGSNTSLTRGR